MQAVVGSLNCMYGFDAATLKQQLKEAWGVDVWLTCNPTCAHQGAGPAWAPTPARSRKRCNRARARCCPHPFPCRPPCPCSSHPCSNWNLLSVELCLDPASAAADPAAVSCPANRTAALGSNPSVVECAGNVWMRLGVEVSIVGGMGWWGGGRDLMGV